MRPNCAITLRCPKKAKANLKEEPSSARLCRESSVYDRPRLRSASDGPPKTARSLRSAADRRRDRSGSVALAADGGRRGSRSGLGGQLRDRARFAAAVARALSCSRRPAACSTSCLRRRALRSPSRLAEFSQTVTTERKNPATGTIVLERTTDISCRKPARILQTFSKNAPQWRSHAAANPYTWSIVHVTFP
jgi:hypothetical protein